MRARRNTREFRRKLNAADASRRRFIAAVKLTVGCEHCGYAKHACALDFDHIDPTIKSFFVSRTPATRAMLTLVLEMFKCRVLCANCHRVAHHVR